MEGLMFSLAGFSKQNPVVSEHLEPSPLVVRYVRQIDKMSKSVSF